MLLALCLCSAAYADEPIVAGGDWGVVYTGAGKLENTFKNADLVSVLKGLQPGDTMILRIPISNDNKETVDWYFKNIVEESFEETAAKAAGAGYSYKLVYNGPGSATGGDIIYDSDKVGGETSKSTKVGLHEATSALENYVFLDTLKTGESGELELTITLDGESMGNDYQDTLAKLQIQFAVEASGEPIIDTGDSARTLPYFAAMIICGLVILFIVLDGITDRKYGLK